MSLTLPRGALSHVRLHFALVLLVIGVAGAASAQELAAAPAETGTLVVMAFSESGEAPPPLEVRCGAQSAQTDEGGLATLEVPAGTCAVTVSALGPTQGSWKVGDVVVAEGLQSEVLLTLGAKDAVALDVEAPPAPASGLQPPEPVDGATQADLGRATFGGRVTADANGKPVRGAKVLIRGGKEVETDETGAFSIAVEAGPLAYSIVHPKFRAKGGELTLIADETINIEVKLLAAAIELSAVTVTAPHIAGTLASSVDARKNAGTITEVLGAEEMSRNGDGDAAAALSRVTGITLVGGRYVYVRGLGERYSSTLLNGAQLPSPEPERRVVPLDLFPTGVLESVTVRKAYSPDLPGEFGGGTIALTTRSVPEDTHAKLSFSVGGQLGSTLTFRPLPDIRPFDVVGIDGGFRALPAKVREASSEQTLSERDRFSSRGYTAEELQEFGTSMANTQWRPQSGFVAPDFGFSAELGDRFHVMDTPYGALQVGALGAFQFGNQWRGRDFSRDYFLLGDGGDLEVGHSYDFSTTANQVDVGGMTNVGVELGKNHRVQWTQVLGRMSENEARTYQGFNRDVGSDIRVDRLRFVERTLLAEQLTGTHVFPSLFHFEIDWGYTYAMAARGEPDRREVRFDQEPTDPDVWLLSDRPEGNQRVFSDLLDHAHDARLVLRLPFKQWNGLDASASVGAQAGIKTRAVDTRRYKYEHKGAKAGDSALLRQEPEDIFVPENLSSDGFQLAEITRQTDNYSAHQSFGAAFVDVNLPLWHRVTATGGVRLEAAEQRVETFALFNPDQEPVVATLQTLDVLPAASLAYEIIDGMKLRASSSITVSRPDLRELSPATFNDVTGGRQIFGNPDLERAHIFSGDLRWEWYPRAAAMLSAGVFAKHFQNPIEQVVVLSAQQSITYANAEEANNVGVEFDGRTDFGFVHPWLAPFYAGANVALIWSRVNLGADGIQTSNERALQGQSPYVANLQGGVQTNWRESPDAESDWATRVGLLYNVVGDRIVQVGAQGAPDVYERPFHSLDLVVRQQLPANLALSFKAKNLLDLAAERVQGGKSIERVFRGRTVSLSLSWTY